jgi:hypothetical protein
MGFVYHFMITLPKVNPFQKAAKTTVSPDLILPFPKLPLKQLVWASSRISVLLNIIILYRSIQISFE